MLPFRERRINIDAHLVSLAFLLFILRQSMPLFKYPFAALFFYLLSRFAFLILKGDLKIPRFKDLSVFRPVLFAFLTVLIAFLLSEKHYMLIFKEVFSGLILIILFLFLTLLIKDKESLIDFIKLFIKQLLFFAALISISVILDLFGIVSYEDYFMIKLAVGETLPYDYNFGILPVVISIFILLYYLLNFDYSVSIKIIFNLLLVFFSFTCFISGSNRGFISITLLNISIFIFLLLPSSVVRLKAERIKVKLSIYLAYNLLIIIFIYLFVTQVSFIAKNGFLNLIGTKEIIETKERLTNNLYKHYSLFDHSRNFNEFHKLLWSINFDPFDPDKGWAGIGAHSTVFPLTGPGRDMIPAAAKGCLLDKFSQLRTWDGDSYSITHIGQLPCDTTYHVETSIFCYVSNNFNANWVRLILLYTNKKQINIDYDLSRKGTWQKLATSDRCSGYPASADFYFAKLDEINFNSLEGYVIIAYPMFRTIDKNGIVNSFYNLNTFQSPKYSSNNHRQNFAKILIPKSVRTAGLYDFDQNINIPSIKFPIQAWLKNFYKEDTSYIRLKKEPVGLSEISSVNDNRLTRWKFAINVYLQEYNFWQKIVGRGFVHLNWYGKYFLNDKTKIDWPHNPFLSTLLYSGIVGLLVYIFLICKVFQYYLNYIKEYSLLFIFFLTTFLFSFVSGDGPYDPPIMGFFIILPFFIKYIHERDKSLNEKI